MATADSTSGDTGAGGTAVRVVLPLPLDKAYTYLVPPAMQDDARVGTRVLVPFGRRRLTGMVVERADDDAGRRKLKPILDVLDEAPSFTGEMLRLTQWMADYYVCGWGEVVRAALPAGIGVESRRRVRLVDDAVPSGVGGKAGRILEDLHEHGETTVSALRRRCGDVPLASLRRLAEHGLIELETELTEPDVGIKHEKHVRFAPDYARPGATSTLVESLPGNRQVAVVQVLVGLAKEGTTMPRQADVLAMAEAPASTIQSLVRRGIVEVVEREVIRSPFGDMAIEQKEPPRHRLHAEQAHALERISAAIDAGRFETFLLHGVTGSGKTEVYIAALRSVLERGKTGIILVPEIALTPQTVQRFYNHFGDRIAVLHSRMSKGERYDAWRHLRSGRYSVAIGPRSAVLAPLSNLGLVVVDEEHEHSYKQFDPAPRYHARDVAVMRAHMNDAVCVLGSATPSLESFVNAQSGKYTLLDMPARVPVEGGEAAAMPAVRVVDLTLERKKHQLEGVLAKPLREAIADRLAKNEQIILLQNRRGYAPVIECRACAWVPSCPDCDVSMTYHKAQRKLRCHYCGRVGRLQERCPECGEHELAQIGTGTQRVEEEMRACFPDARVLRMDQDTTGRKNAHHDILRRFGRHEADILLGTQMVAKGLDFARVTLVGVVDADVGMLLPDFRSDERTFQLLTQVAGRAGRAELPGEVLLQTRRPRSPAILFALAHDYAGFADTVLPERHRFHYPPFGRMAGVEFRGPDERRVEDVAQRWTRLLKQHTPPSIEILGPQPPFVARIKRAYRFHTVLKTPRSPHQADLQALLRHVNGTFGSPPRGYRIAIDVDPMELF